MLNILIGLGIAGFGLFNIVQAQFIDIDTTPLWWVKMLASSVVGLGFAGYELFPLIKLPKFKLQEKSVDMPKELGPEITIKTEEETDLECVFYLSERLKDMPEGLEMCRKINDLLFSLHHPLKVK